MAALISHFMSGKSARLTGYQDNQEEHIKDVHMSSSLANTVTEPRVVVERRGHDSSAVDTSGEEEEEEEASAELEGNSADEDEEEEEEEEKINSENGEDESEQAVEESGDDIEDKAVVDDDSDEDVNTGEQESQEEDADEVEGEEGTGVEDDEDDIDDDEDDVSDLSNRLSSRKRRAGARNTTVSEEGSDEDGEDDDENESVKSTTSDQATSDSDVSERWEDEDEDEEQEDEESNASEEIGERAITNEDPCIFCEEGDDDGSSQPVEETLFCRACGDHAHPQCARDAKSLVSGEDANRWQCPSCAENMTASNLTETNSLHRRRSSAPKITRDLLPVHRGSNKEGAHSIFNNLILHDDPMDGSRSLRKRKSSELAEDKVVSLDRKRRRMASSGGAVQVELADLDQFAIMDDDAEAISTDKGTGSTSRPRSARSRVQRKPQKPAVSILQHSSDTLLLSFNLSASKLGNLANESRKRRRRDRERERRARLQQPEPVISHYPALQPSSFAAPFLTMFEKDGDESKAKPYGGILDEEEADTTATFPQSPDRRKFEDARLKAEDEWRKKIEAAKAIEQGRQLPKVAGPPSKIKCINFGGYEIDTWHAAPYPEEYSRNRVLYICEFCLKYLNSDFVAWRHKLKCPARHPPGDEIYRDGQFSFFEVDGRKNPVYCQNLCLLAKLFLGSKTLYYDVEPFLFYVMTENDDYGCHFVGYFSKEKRPSSLNNVSCILVLPIHQRRGFGHMLIEFSYLLTKVEKKTGSPEKPLSDMGLVSYRSYWRLILCYELLNQQAALSVNDISDLTGMTADDIVCGLEGLRALVRDPISKTYALRLDHAFFRQYIDAYEKKGYAKLNPDALTWVPYVMGRDNSHYENAAPLHTVAQRDGDTNAVPEEGVQLSKNGVSEKDYAETKTEGNTPSASTDLMTPQEELLEQTFDRTPTPFPSFDASAENREHHSKSGANVHPSTPWTNGSQGATSPVPATRFEVFPPVPGNSTRKRPGRPSLGRGVRRGSSLRQTTNGGEGTPLGTAIPTRHHYRSKLAEAVNGVDGETEMEEPSLNGETEANNAEGEDDGGD